MSPDLPLFLEEFRRVFSHPTSRADAAGRLHSIKQGGLGIAAYTLEFRTLAADSGWDDVALRSAYRRGLSKEFKDLLVRNRPTSLNDLVSLAYPKDKRLREQRLERAQRSIRTVRMPSARSGANPSRPQGPTPAPVLSSAGAGLSRSVEEEEPMQLGAHGCPRRFGSNVSGCDSAPTAGETGTSSVPVRSAQTTRLTRRGGS